MQPVSSDSQYCGSCGGENPAEAIRCVHCSDVLDPAVQTQAAPSPPLDVRTAAIVGAVAAVLMVVLHVAGLSFSMRLLPAEASGAEIQTRLDTLVDEGALEEADASSLWTQLRIEAQGRAALRSGELSPMQAASLRERVPPQGQSTVLGVPGILGLVPMLIAFLAAATIGVAVARGRRLREVAMGLGAACLVQLVLWSHSVEFDVSAISSGRLLMVGPGPAFTGAPVLLLVVALAGGTAAGCGLGYAVGFGLDQAQGKADCPHCGHVFPRTKGQLHCPSCTRPLEVTQAASSGPGGMTRAASGAQELLCIQCVKTYAADVCPVHADEPLLDPRREDVRFQLLDLDTQAGTSVFSRWTEGLGQHGEDVAPATGGVCMECARALDTPACSIHPDEPLLDPAREDVRIEMEEADDRRRRQVGAFLMFGAFFLAATLTGTLMASLELDSSLMVSLFAGALLGLIAVARVLTPALSPPRFGAWTGARAISGSALAGSAHSELLAPLQRGLALILARLMWFALAGVAGAALGAGVVFALGWPIALGTLLGGLIGLIAFAAVVTLIDTGRELEDAASQAAQAWRDPYG